MLNEARIAFDELNYATRELVEALNGYKVPSCKSKAGMRRVRTASIKVEKAAKAYRKATLALDKPAKNE